MKPGLIELDDNYILLSVLGFIWVMYLWETYLTIRQVSERLSFSSHVYELQVQVMCFSLC